VWTGVELAFGVWGDKIKKFRGKWSLGGKIKRYRGKILILKKFQRPFFYNFLGKTPPKGAM
jgi:hypothetical protein